MKYELMMFENHIVEIVEINGELYFNPYHVGTCLGLDDGTIHRYMQYMNDNQVVKLTNSIVGENYFRQLHSNGENFLTEDGIYTLFYRYRPRTEKAERFQEWFIDEVLPKFSDTPSLTPKEHLEILQIIMEDLHMGKASKLETYNNFFKAYNLSTNILPKYDEIEEFE